MILGSIPTIILVVDRKLSCSILLVRENFIFIIFQPLIIVFYDKIFLIQPHLRLEWYYFYFSIDKFKQRSSRTGLMRRKWRMAQRRSLIFIILQYINIYVSNVFIFVSIYYEAYLYFYSSVVGRQKFRKSIRLSFIFILISISVGKNSHMLKPNKILVRVYGGGVASSLPLLLHSWVKGVVFASAKNK